MVIVSSVFTMLFNSVLLKLSKVIILIFAPVSNNKIN